MFKVFSVYDHKSEQYNTPQFIRTKGEAIRGFQAQCQREEPSNLLRSNPEDFTMYMLGEYNPEDGTLVGIEPQVVISAKDFFSELKQA